MFKKNREIAKLLAVFFLLILFTKVGTKLTEKGNKKPRISDDLAVGEIQGLRSADADQHRDRITRFGILKHRAKQQEQYLFSVVDYKNLADSDLNYKK